MPTANLSANILLVEDSLLNQAVMVAMLRSAGHQVDLADCGTKGIEAASEKDYDIILMDISMPDMSGMEATAIIRQLGGTATTVPIIAITAHAQTHGLITTPGATRFYRSDGPLALQTTHITMQAGSRLEWLPLEALCYNECHAENKLVMALEPGSELLGWDVTAFGLPHANLPFVKGSFAQHIEVPGVWLERGRVDASDKLLMDGAAGLAGARCMVSLFFVTGSILDRKRKQQTLDTARDLIAGHALAATAGATSPNNQVIVVRALAPVVEPAMQLLRAVRNAWRQELWSLPPCSPRIWAM